VRATGAMHLAEAVRKGRGLVDMGHSKQRPQEPPFGAALLGTNLADAVVLATYFSEMLPEEDCTSTRALPSPMRARSSCLLVVPSMTMGMSASMSPELERA
jgi:hypothetical protein